MLTKFYVRMQSLKSDDEGATALEYAILVALIALFIIAGVRIFGTALNTFFTNIAGAVPF